MFTEYLASHPLAGLLRAPLPRLCPDAGDRSAWDGIPAPFRQEIERNADKAAALPYPARPASAFLAFVRNGSRTPDEEPYFARRRKLCWAALDACLKDELSDSVTDGLWCICEETAWVISAHNTNPIPGAPVADQFPLPDPDAPYIDLFSAQTGMILTLVCHLLSARLDGLTPMLRSRVYREVEKRILTPFETRDDFWWMGVTRKDLNNWTPWIVSNVMVCACLVPMEKDRLCALLEKGCVILDRWLDTVPEDGGCDEGAGYWNMAGGSLLDCLELLEKLTGGQMSFRDRPKIRNILLFPLRAHLGNGWFINFADCDARPFLSGERLQLAGEYTGCPELSALGAALRGTLADQLSDVPHFTRLLSLLFSAAPSEPPAPVPAEDAWLPDLQVRVLRRGDLALCAKGGNNGESHNHNDVGSFMVYARGLPEVVDAGNMVYTAKTFSARRYTLWNVRSAYHNLPLIGGREQPAGREYAARAEYLSDGLRLDLKDAWDGETGLLSYTRKFRAAPEAVTVRDRMELARPQSVSWVLMLRNRPDLSGYCLTAGNLLIRWPEGLIPEAEEIPVTDSRMARSFPGSLWRVILRAEPAQAFDICFCFQIQEQEVTSLE